jgi:hypothetical protein
MSELSQGNNSWSQVFPSLRILLKWFERINLISNQNVEGNKNITSQCHDVSSMLLPSQLPSLWQQ